MSIYQILWVFFLYSFLGWCTEVIYHAFVCNRFINRGFLFGPVCPIYGIGLVAVTMLIDPISEHILQAYLVAALIPTLLEYLVGWIAEKALHMRLWDYSDLPLNINGYVCLLFSLLWGIGCLVVYYGIHPFLLRVIGILPTTLGWIILAIFAALMITDFILTGMEALKIPKALKAADEMEAALLKLSDSIGMGLSDKALLLREKGKAHEGQFDNLEQLLSVSREDVRRQLEELSQKYRLPFTSPNKVYQRLRLAFPHVSQTAAGKKLTHTRKLYRKIREYFGN